MRERAASRKLRVPAIRSDEFECAPETHLPAHLIGWHVCRVAGIRLLHREICECQFAARCRRVSRGGQEAFANRRAYPLGIGQLVDRRPPKLVCLGLVDQDNLSVRIAQNLARFDVFGNRDCVIKPEQVDYNFVALVRTSRTTLRTGRAFCKFSSSVQSPRSAEVMALSVAA